MAGFNTSGVEWERKSRPRQKDQGHTLIRNGYRDEGYYRGRQFAECECGKIMTAEVTTRFAPDKTYYAWTRHLKTLGIR